MHLSRLASAASVFALLAAAACTTPAGAADPTSLVAAPSTESRASAILAELVVAPASAEAFTARCDNALALDN